MNGNYKVLVKTNIARVELCVHPNNIVGKHIGSPLHTNKKLKNASTLSTFYTNYSFCYLQIAK